MPNHDSAGLAKRAKELREKSGLTLKAVGERLAKPGEKPISRQSIHQAEDGTRTGLDSLRIRIIETLGGTVIDGPLYIERDPGLFDGEHRSGRAEEQRSRAA